ncbi:MAG: gamma-glutamylcyclotransferase family protein [Streptosporangiaceae bacterium]
MALYAAYGSNMDPAQMAERCPHSPQAGTGWLDGWRLTFGGEDIGWEGALATVVEDQDSRVFVVLYEVSETDEEALDRWDGATLGYYRKLRVRVATLDGDALAWLYVLNDYEGGLPAARYLGIMADAAEAAGAPSDYVMGLRARPCSSLGG